MRSGNATSYILFLCLAFIHSSCVPAPESQSAVSRDITPSPTPAPFSCDKFTLDHWRELRFGVDSPEEYVETVEKTWGIKYWITPFNSEGNTDTSGLWIPNISVSSEFYYSVQFDKGQRLLHVTGFWPWQDFRRPTLAEVIDCLGTPEHYVAAYVKDDIHWLEFSLWYIEKGILVQGSSDFRFFKQMAVRPNIIMRNTATYGLRGDFVVAEPGNLKQMISDVYGPALQAWKLCLIRPWPGSIEAIEILPFEEYLRCAT